jgi:ribonuclease VapC
VKSGILAIDSSAFIAILGNEPERDDFIAIVVNASRRITSAATLLETRIVLYNRHRDEGVAALDRFIARASIEVMAVDERLSNRAFDLYCRFGKGVGAPPVLNFGNCFSLALAEAEGALLLFKGDDFSRCGVVAPVRE